MSVVLRGKEGKIAVSDEVRQRIVQAASELNYRSSRSTRMLRAGRTNVIGFVSTNYMPKTGKVANHLTYPFMVGLNHRLIEDDFHTVLVELSELEAKSEKLLPGALRERFFDGLVVHFGLSPRALELIRACGIPTVYLDSGVVEPERCIHRDGFKVGQTAAEMLLQLGHRRIAYFMTAGHWHLFTEARHVIDHHSFVSRTEGYEAALKARGLEPLYLVAQPTPLAMARRMKEEGITAVIFGGGDRVPGPLVQAMILAGLRMPEDISMLSCDVETRAGATVFEMGGILYDRFLAGYAAAGQILRLVHDPRATVPSQSLPVEGRLGSTIASAP